MSTKQTDKPMSTKQTTTSHLRSLNTNNTTTYHVGNPGSGLGQVQKGGRVKLPFLITVSPMAIQE